MAQISFFHYIHRDSVLHRMDGRLKLICLLLVSLSASFASEWHNYLGALFITVIALILTKLPVNALLKEMKFFAAIIILVFIANAVSVPGDPIPNSLLTNISVQGITAGGRFAGRLIIILIACIVMTGTTPLLTLKNVIEWYLRPVPFIPEVQVATMINLTFVLLPVILDNYSEMMSAQRSRCIQLNRNPIRRVAYIVFPLLSRTIRRADEIVYAMEARCYCVERTRAVFKTNKVDWLIIAVCVVNLIYSVC